MNPKSRPLVVSYPKLKEPNFPKEESTILKFWIEDDTFQASLDIRANKKDYVIYDGPPFANGYPHYGHLLTGYIKDLIPRYRTMRGYKVERIFGWDTHGLPAELEVQKQLGITHKSQIEEIGIEKFNNKCRSSVLKYTKEWQTYVVRQARWVDFKKGYKTLDTSFIESVMWAFKKLWTKNLAYEDNRVLPYCWNDETPLSNHELRMDDDVYKNRQDLALTLGFYILDGLIKGAYFLVWTTTPWTLPSNQAIAINPTINYFHINSFSGKNYVLSQSRLDKYIYELGKDLEIVGIYSGSDLLGIHYLPPFVYFMNTQNSFQILKANFVSSDNGTGAVHIAPSYGEEDKSIADLSNIVGVNPVNSKGIFDSSIIDYLGQHIFQANYNITRDLKNCFDSIDSRIVNISTLLSYETYEHKYPHCWRCNNPLIYRSVSSWFIKVTAFRDRMVELNEQIRWHPAYIKNGQFRNWLSNARDWSISRNRYWGSPIPVWKSDNPSYPRIDVYGSIDEIEYDFGTRLNDLHRPFIDSLTRSNPDDPSGKSMMRRINDVFDVWFDSGSMPYAQVHYPFENQDWFEGNNNKDAHFPSDFVVEYVGQTRGWFYTMHVLATALFDKPAFKNVIAHGIILGDDGLKMSKSRHNYPAVSKVFDCDGSDAMRWFLIDSSIINGGNLIVTYQGIRESIRRVLLPLRNSYSFLALYASNKGNWRTNSDHPLDQYILSKLAQTCETLTFELDVYEISKACYGLKKIIEILTNWYVRRSRSRFWKEDIDAIDTLHTALEIICRLAAPFLPLTTEMIWKSITGKRSVHLTNWPESNLLPNNKFLTMSIDKIREICSLSFSLRKLNNLRVRLPLLSLTIVIFNTTDSNRIIPFLDIIADELNVKSINLTNNLKNYGKFDFKVNAHIAGPRIKKYMQNVIKEVKSRKCSINQDGTLTTSSALLMPGEYSSKLVTKECNWATTLANDSGLILLYSKVTKELEAEGWAKDRIRELQELRKKIGLEVSDRINMKISSPNKFKSWTINYKNMITNETLVKNFTFSNIPSGIEIGSKVWVNISKI